MTGMRTRKVAFLVISLGLFLLPDDVSLLNVKGKELRDWKITEKDGKKYLDVYFNFGIKGKYLLSLTYEKNIGEESVIVEASSVKAVGIERENGYIGIASKTNVEVKVNDHENVSIIDVNELLSKIRRNASTPLLLAFRYLKHPFHININIKRHEDVPVLVAAVDSAQITTVHTEEGKILTKIIYEIRNNVKQFLRMVLPKDAVLWSVFVSGEPVKPSKDGKGNILIPLKKSEEQDLRLGKFLFEIVYLGKGKKISSLIGSVEINIPAIDIPVNEFYFDAFMPENFLYFNISKGVKARKEKKEAFLKWKGA